MKNEDKKIYVRNAVAVGYEDDFENGEIDRSQFHIDISYMEGVYNSLLEFCKEYNLLKLDNFNIDSGKFPVLGYTMIQDSDGNEVEVGSDKWEGFKKGEEKLFNVYYDFGIEFIKTYTPNEKELNKEIELLSMDKDFDF